MKYEKAIKEVEQFTKELFDKKTAKQFRKQRHIKSSK